MQAARQQGCASAIHCRRIGVLCMTCAGLCCFAVAQCAAEHARKHGDKKGDLRDLAKEYLVGSG
jgi:hypothetical protein